MSDQLGSDPQSVKQIQTSLQQLAQGLREAQQLEPEAREDLADLVEELSKTLDPATIPSDETAQLARSTAHLAQLLHQEHNPTLLASAKKRLQDAALTCRSQRTECYHTRLANPGSSCQSGDLTSETFQADSVFRFALPSVTMPSQDGIVCLSDRVQIDGY